MADDVRSHSLSAGDATARIGEVAYLTVATVNDTGAFLRWGPPKDVLLPYSEQRFRPDPGKRVLVMLYEDDQGRPVASQRLDRFLSDDAWALESGQQVAIVVADRTDLGMKVVVDHRYWGLIYQDDITRPLRRGQSVTGYVKQRRDDGRVDISLLPPGAARLDVVGEKVLAALKESGGYLPLGDKSDAHAIKARLGVSKSAYKQAIGRLYKQQLITLEPGAIRLVSGALSS
ncbi:MULTISPECIES: S1 RNA-binding domain-containing protein [unclassified Halomonas]|uniref:CvfB family protein n=1 Tax=unclassified Halomonas TaxID=2609666 RepID=UPI00209D31BC|nr:MULTISPECIES: S1-like domain-containing RNA-binding protein [unclassified Halomonas]MCP1315365.1 S1-like domain-containing RNA-binding protein [Halomonas sp. 707D7]MCP1327133.1 S1-like domain-containing RNA-binding protein [Halomonas sp. 707D4]